MPLRRLRPVPLPEGVGLSAPEGFVPEVPPDVHRAHPPVTVSLTGAGTADTLAFCGLRTAASPYPVADLEDERSELRAITRDDDVDECVRRALRH